MVQQNCALCTHILTRCDNILVKRKRLRKVNGTLYAKNVNLALVYTSWRYALILQCVHSCLQKMCACRQSDREYSPGDIRQVYPAFLPEQSRRQLNNGL